MSRTITALFDTRDDAEAGRQRLLDAKLDADDVRIHDKSSIGVEGYSSPEQPGMWATIKNAFLPDEDRHIYEEGVRRGGYLLTADVDEDEVDEAIRALENVHGKSVDIDERAKQWKSEGWTAPVVGAAAEEQLIAGKREVERGGARVRSYVTEQPVHEQTRLREERIGAERHPVDRPADDDAYYRNHFNSTYGTSGGSYDDYAPAYSYGTQMRSDTRYQGRQWNDVESDLRTDWERRNGSATASTWEKVKAAVRHGWDKVAH